MSGDQQSGAPAVPWSQQGVSIVIPAYNEEKGAAESMRELLDVLDERVEVPYEVIVVDDGSKDRTSEILRDLEGERMKLVVHPKNRGYGAAIKTGIRHAKHPWIMITDADGTYPAEHIPDLLAERDHHEMVVGARIGEHAHVPLIRRPPKWVLRKLASYLSRNHIPDLNSGLRVFRKDLARRLENILPDQFSYTTTITLGTFSAGYQVKYVPINYRRRKGSSKIPAHRGHPRLPQADHPHDHVLRSAPGLHPRGDPLRARRHRGRRRQLHADRADHGRDDGPALRDRRAPPGPRHAGRHAQPPARLSAAP